MADFAIFTLDALVGRLGLSAMPGRGGDFGADMAVVAGWRPDLIVSTCPERELVSGGAGTIGQAARSLGAGWAHWSIADFGIPEGQEAAAWPGLRARLLTCLGGGGAVLVHCAVGCGRSGMTLLRLMVDAGTAPTTALTALRQVRPCAVETDAQMRWATRGAIRSAH